MALILCEKNVTDSTTMSSAYCNTIYDLMKKDSRIMHLDADLASAVLGGGMKKMREELPNQYLDCGIQESNMAGVAAGLAVCGKIPFAHTFAAFASRRIADQVFISACYAKAHLCIVGSDPGISAAYNGGTHMPFEDISIYRAYPEMTIVEPADNVALQKLLPQIAYGEGVYYLRLFRKNPVCIYDEGSEFTIGKHSKIKDGKDVMIIASGIMVAEALKAVRMLEEKGIDAGLIDMHTIKPLDEEAVIEAASKTGAIVTAENHNVLNGLGSAVADVLATKQYAVLEKVGVKDRFGEVGPLEELYETFNLTAKDIVEAALKAIDRKNNR